MKTHLEILLFELVDTIGGNYDGVHLGVRSIKRNPRFCTILLQLIESSRTICVSADETRLPALLLVVVRHLEIGFVWCWGNACT